VGGRSSCGAKTERTTLLRSEARREPRPPSTLSHYASATAIREKTIAGGDIPYRDLRSPTLSPFVATLHAKFHALPLEEQQRPTRAPPAQCGIDHVC
jgi:hypothetical protein